MMENQEAAQSHFTTMPITQNSYQAHYEYSDTISLWGYHSHDFYEFYFHVHGGEYYGVDDRLYLLEPDQLIIIPPFCMHGMSNAGDNRLREYERGYLNISPETLNILGCGQIDLDRYFRSYTAQGHLFQMTPEEARSCMDAIREIEQNLSQSEVERLNCFSLMLQVISTICRVLQRSESSASSISSNSVIQKVLTYINSHYTQPLNMKDLSKQFGLSVSSLSHGFARFTNWSVYDYVLYRRIMLAKEMIQSEQSLNTIAYQCGFNDYSNFLRAFNKLVGISPSDYRKQLRRSKNPDEA